MTARSFLFLLATAAVALSPASQAQATFKVGYIDTDQVVVRMQDFAAVQQRLAQEQQAVGARVRVVQDSLNQILQTRLQAYETFSQSALATDDARRTRQTELVQLQGQIEQAESQGLQYLSYVEARLLQPVLGRVDEAISAEAEGLGLDLVLPTVANNAPVFLYASDRLVNITEPVMRRLGIDPSAPVPGQQAGAPATPAPTGN
jgi:Skp family chaperone for outer membrane proteins